MKIPIKNKSEFLSFLNLPSPGVSPETHAELWTRSSGQLSGIAVDKNLINLELKKVLYSAGLELDYVMAFSWIAERVGAQTPWHCDGRSYRDEPQQCSINWHWSSGTCIEMAKEWNDGVSNPTNYAWRVWEDLEADESLTIYDYGPFLMDIQWPHRVNLLDKPDRKSLVLRFKNNPTYTEVYKKLKVAELINEIQ